MHILGSLLAFCVYLFIGMVMVIIFLFIYSKITPHNECQLIKNNNTAAYLAFSGICHSLVQRGNKLSQHSGLFRLG